MNESVTIWIGKARTARPIPEGFVLVGLVDLGGGRQPFAYEGRQAYAIGPDGPTALPHGDISEALFQAVDRAAQLVFGPEWTARLATVSGLNPRACMSGRIRSNGLPVVVLDLLATAASDPAPRALGHMMQAVGWNCWPHPDRPDEEPPSWEAVARGLERTGTKALNLMQAMRDDTLAARARRRPQEPQPVDEAPFLRP